MPKKFMQKRTSSRDNASPSTPDTEVPDADSPNVNATPFESDHVNESMESSSYDYEVFLSFRGPDTRSGFTDFLYTRLNKAGIRVYRDDEELRTGEEIGSELLQAINQSKILIPIFSKGYAFSKWCLMELVQMVECQNEIGQKIMPIFYDVAPREVRHQIGEYEKAFDMHAKEKRYDDRTINKWKDALTQVGALKGWDLTIKPNRREGEFVEEVTRRVLTELKRAYLEVSDCLVDMDSKVEEIMRLIGTPTTTTRIIGIHGMGGIGKTTLAKIVYNRLSRHFQYCCFLADIRETSDREGIKGLQNQFIFAILRIEGLNINNVDEGIEMIKMRLRWKRVLLLFDDVDKKTQLDALIGDHRWYGKGSKVIITTRNKEILNVPKVDWSYELLGMDFDNSLQLFSRHAFRRDHPLEEYYSNSVKAINISGGLPLALEVIGSFLCGKDKKFWVGTLKKLEKVPHEDVKKKLMISFEVLDDRQKNIFLDIACFFIGFDRKIVVYMWDSCDFFPEEAIEVLQQRSLIKVTDDDQLWMHDQLRDLGRDIVHQKSKTRTNEQSRVWDHVQIFDVLKSKEEMRNIEAICLKFDHQSQYCFTNEEFERLPNLRFLQIESINFDETAKYKFISKEPPILPKLKWLSWHRVPQDFTLDSFSLMELVILDLSRSKITENWDGWNHIKLKKLVLQCHRLRSLSRLPTSLSYLCLKNCNELSTSLDLSNLVALKELYVINCSKIEEIQGLEGLENVRIMELSAPRLQKLPDLTNLRQLRRLHLQSQCVVELKGTFESLERIEFMFCFNLEKVPDPLSFKKLKCAYSFCSEKLDGYVKSSDNWRNWIQNNEYVSSPWGTKFKFESARLTPPMQPPLGNFY